MSDTPERLSRWWFAEPTRQAALHTAVSRWIGTPFRKGSMVPGASGGVDCVHLTLALQVAAGSVAPCVFPTAPLDYSLHQRESLIEAFLEGRASDPASRHIAEVAELVEVVEPGERSKVPLLPGDVVTIRIHHCAHHVVTVLDGDGAIAHVHAGDIVMLSTLADPTYGARVSRVYRARELGGGEGGAA